MKIVLDTNVVVSGLIRPLDSAPGALLDLWYQGRFDLVVSPGLVREYRLVLNRPKVRQWIRVPSFTARFLRHLEELATLVEAPELDAVEVRDPKDRVVLATAARGRADLVVTGDGDLLVLKAFQGIPILTPRAALARLGLPRDPRHS